MLSPSDTIIIFAAALLLFGPEHLPRIAKQLGEAMRHIQNTTQTFMQEMDRAAAAAEIKAAKPVAPESLPDTAIAQESPTADEAQAVPESHPEASAEKSEGAAPGT